MTGGARRRFLDYAALARSKPSFDVEERDWPLELAAQLASVPLVRPVSFRRLAGALGETIDEGDGSPTGFYAGMLDFARRIREELVQAGVSVRDMIDVQSLIDVCSNEARVWAVEPPADWL